VPNQGKSRQTMKKPNATITSANGAAPYQPRATLWVRTPNDPSPEGAAHPANQGISRHPLKNQITIMPSVLHPRTAPLNSVGRRCPSAPYKITVWPATKPPVFNRTDQTGAPLWRQKLGRSRSSSPTNISSGTTQNPSPGFPFKLQSRQKPLQSCLIKAYQGKSRQTPDSRIQLLDGSNRRTNAKPCTKEKSSSWGEETGEGERPTNLPNRVALPTPTNQGKNPSNQGKSSHTMKTHRPMLWAPVAGIWLVLPGRCAPSQKNPGRTERDRDRLSIGRARLRPGAGVLPNSGLPAAIPLFSFELFW